MALFQEALANFNQGNIPEAQQLAQQQLLQDPEHHSTLHLLGLIAQRKGLFSEAIHYIEQAITLYPHAPHYYNNLGTLFLSQLQFKKAIEVLNKAIQIQGDFAEAHGNIARAYFQTHQLPMAIQHLTTATQLKPEFAEAYTLLGMAHHQQGLFEQAEAYYKQALQLKTNPFNAAEHLKNLQRDRQVSTILTQAFGAFQSGDLKTAEPLLLQALQLNPAIIDTYHCLATIWKGQKKYHSAIELYKKSLEYAPEDPRIFDGIGSLYLELKDYSQAIYYYQQAIQLDKTQASFYFNLAIAFFESNQIKAALDACISSIHINPEHTQNMRLFIQCLLQVNSGDIQHLLQSPIFIEAVNLAFDSKYINKQRIVFIVIELLKFDPLLQQYLSGSTTLNYVECKEKWLKTNVLSQLKNSLFIKCLKYAIFTSNNLEFFLRNLRKFVLEASLKRLMDIQQLTEQKCMTFLIALSLQCLNNEYVYWCDPEEQQWVMSLKNEIANITWHKPTPEEQFKVVLYSLYEPIRSLPFKAQITQSSKQGWSQTFQDFIQNHLLNFEEEERIKETIEQLTPIQEATSQQVQNQYEENPYPRWISSDLQTPQNPPIVFKKYFPHFDYPENLKQNSPDILIAGCGTGKQVVLSSTEFKQANILAIDLSQASLAYAIRKVKELNLPGIIFKQADILELNKQNTQQTFDIIESTGVLHHLKNPVQGWKNLVELLKPSGLMKVALYSQHTRHSLVQARQLIHHETIKSSQDIRQARWTLIQKHQNEIKDILEWRDFYSLSECRDLLFHVQEHCFTLTEIIEILKQLNLKFIGFNLPNTGILASYKELFPDNPEADNLVYWNELELKNPDIFKSMYNFWCQKI